MGLEVDNPQMLRNSGLHRSVSSAALLGSWPIPIISTWLSQKLEKATTVYSKNTMHIRCGEGPGHCRPKVHNKFVPSCKILEFQSISRLGKYFPDFSLGISEKIPETAAAISSSLIRDFLGPGTEIVNSVLCWDRLSWRRTTTCSQNPGAPPLPSQARKSAQKYFERNVL